MNREIVELINTLEDAVFSNGFIYIVEEVTEELKKRSDAFDAVEPILRLMENNPTVDFGRPGALVHFVERFYQHGYEQKLIESINRKPVGHTVWMLNRIINGSHGDQKKYYLEVLDGIILYPNLSDDVVSLVRNFKALQM